MMPSPVGLSVRRALYPRNSRSGFTLVEMLIVSALIALFAGLAVINIQTQLELNKRKAATAEGRNISTAMNSAYLDLSFFPKLCFLRFNSANLLTEFTTLHAGFDALEYHGYFVANLANRITKSWGVGAYLGHAVERQVDMFFDTYDYDVNGNRGSSLGRPSEKWPADPWGNPYVAYILKTNPKAGQAGQLNATFIERATERADFGAWIVSYGRNGVPGLGDHPTDNDLSGRKPLRLYSNNGANPGQYVLAPATDFLSTNANAVQQRLGVFLPSDQPLSDGQPRIQEIGSDDRVVQF